MGAHTLCQKWQTLGESGDAEMGSDSVLFYWFVILVEILQNPAASRRFYSKSRFRATQISGHFKNSCQKVVEISTNIDGN